MDLPDAINRFLGKPAAEETTPFGPDVLVYKVGGKMFALTVPGEFPPRINLKCDPERAIALRDEYESISPGYHMNKRHWNTLVLDRSLPTKLVGGLIDHSYDLVVASLPKSERPVEMRHRKNDGLPNVRSPSGARPSGDPLSSAESIAVSDLSRRRSNHPCQARESHIDSRMDLRATSPQTQLTACARLPEDGD